MNPQRNDAWDSAQNAEMKPIEYLGQVHVDVWFCALVKGTGKVPFDPKSHRLEERRTAIDLVLKLLDLAEVKLGEDGKLQGLDKALAAHKRHSPIDNL